VAHREKPQPPRAKFKISPVDAPNVNGARDLGFPVKATAKGKRISLHSETDVEQGRVRALYVFDPGPDGYIGDVSWIIKARESGRLSLLVVQGVLLTKLAKAADIVLPGASWVEKDGAFVNGPGTPAGGLARNRSSGRRTGRLADLRQHRPRARRVGHYTSSAAIRGEVAAALAGNERYSALSTLAFARPVPARHWLQASNPMERWKWDVMFQDLPPVKFAGTPRAIAPQSVIPLQKVD
jgi:hypothetical protein